MYSAVHPSFFRPLSLLFALGLCASLSWAQFNPIGFEGATIYGVPTVLVHGQPQGDSYGYSFAPGNNLQGLGGIPAYAQAPTFGWRIDGYQQSLNYEARWNEFDATFIGAGASSGIPYPGTGYGQGQSLNNAFNINSDFAAASSHLPSAPGLGTQLLDVWAAPGYSSQISLNLFASQTAVWELTLALGGRDLGSRCERGYFRLIENANQATVFSGDSWQTPLETWHPLQPTQPGEGSVQIPNSRTLGVTQQDWEYFKNTFTVTAGTTYTLQVLLPEELNLDIALGSAYTSTPGALTDFTAVPEPSTYALVGLSASAGFAFWRKRRQRTEAAKAMTS